MWDHSMMPLSDARLSLVLSASIHHGTSSIGEEEHASHDLETWPGIR